VINKSAQMRTKEAMDKVINLTHITILQWILIVIFSGVVVAVINQLGAWIVSAHQTRGQERMQRNEQSFNERLHRDERENQSLQLLITAHFDQREKSLKDAVDVHDWVWYNLRKLHGPDHDYYGDDDPPPNINTVTEVLSALNRVSYFHPTRSVRGRAKGLESSIAYHFNSVNDQMDGLGGDPSYDQLSKWIQSADELIELIHTPPSLDEVRHSNGDVEVQASAARKDNALERVSIHGGP
jgi:hypothetical protein